MASSVPFFEPGALADKIIELASEPQRFAEVSERARESVLTRYFFETTSLPRYLSLIRGFTQEPSNQVGMLPTA